MVLNHENTSLPDSEVLSLERFLVRLDGYSKFKQRGQAPLPNPEITGFERFFVRLDGYSKFKQRGKPLFLTLRLLDLKDSWEAERLSEKRGRENKGDHGRRA
jgi:hypothetical protein